VRTAVAAMRLRDGRELTLPPLAARCRFVFECAGAAFGLTTDEQVASDAVAGGYRVVRYSRARGGSVEHEILLAVPEPDADDDS
jgi:hypothetical protein